MLNASTRVFRIVTPNAAGLFRVRGRIRLNVLVASSNHFAPCREVRQDRIVRRSDRRPQKTSLERRRVNFISTVCNHTMFWPIFWFSGMAAAVIAFFSAIVIEGAKKKKAAKLVQTKNEALATQAGDLNEFPAESLDFPEEPLA